MLVVRSLGNQISCFLAHSCYLGAAQVMWPLGEPLGVTSAEEFTSSVETMRGLLFTAVPSGSLLESIPHSDLTHETNSGKTHGTSVLGALGMGACSLHRRHSGSCLPLQGPRGSRTKISSPCCCLPLCFSPGSTREQVHHGRWFWEPSCPQSRFSTAATHLLSCQSPHKGQMPLCLENPKVWLLHQIFIICK